MDANSLSGLNVLIVDDDTDARELTCMILSAAGAFVDQAASGEEALEKLGSDHRFDVVVSDIAMPHMDGMRLVRAVRESSSRIPVRALAFTAFVTPEDRKGALCAGFDQHLGKTADATTLISVVAGLVGRTVAQAS